MFTTKEIIEYRCPRWNELPDLELYMDQVLSVLQKHLEIFSVPDEKPVTSTMINNYVKQKIIKPPINKKYDRYHLAYFFIVCVLKRIMSLSEICTGIAKLMGEYSTAAAYDLFCDELDGSLKLTFSGERDERPLKDSSEAALIVRKVTIAFANLLYCRYLISKKDIEVIRRESGSEIAVRVEG